MNLDKICYEQFFFKRLTERKGYILILDLESGKYSLIKGNGMQEAVELLDSTDDFETAREKIGSTVCPEHYDKVMEFMDISYFFKHIDKDSYTESIIFPSVYENGVYQWCKLKLIIGKQEAGKPLISLIGRDITEEVRQEEKWRREQKEAAEKDRILSIISKTFYGYILSINLKTLQYNMITGSGTNVAEFLGEEGDYTAVYSQLKKYVHEDCIEELNEHCSPEALKKLEGKDGYSDIRAYSFWIGGNIERHELNTFVITNEDEETVVYITGRDITESYRAQIRREEELRSASVKDHILSEMTKKLYSYNIVVNLATREFDIIEGNGMAHIKNVLYAFPRYEDAINTLLNYVDPEHKEAFADAVCFDSVYKRRHERGLIQTLEYASIAGGKKEWHEIHVFMERNENDEPIVNFLGRDITEAHDKAEALAQLEIATKTNAAKSMFLSNMSHDMRTPINGIIGMLTRAKKHMNEPEVLADSLEKIQVSSSHLLSLINDVLDISKLEAGKMEFAEETFSLKSLLNTCCSITQGQLEDGNVEFITDFSNIVHSNLMGSELHIRQVLLNILGNAVKYTPEGEVRFIVNEVFSNEEKAGFQFIVKDTGIGMSEEFQKNIFDAFTQENNNVARTRYAGTGLGMSIVHRLVQEMGGEVSVESKLDVGSTFTVELEFPIALEEQIEKPEENEDITINTEGLKVLLVEDNELNMEFEKEILEDEGCVVSVAYNGKEALDMFINSASGTFDMILMDVMMPIMNGIDATKEIRRSGHPDAKWIPIIAQTANTFKEDIQAVKTAGMNEHVAKPIDIEHLLRVMSKYRK